MVDCESFGGISVEALELFCKDLPLVLPDGYRAFLQESNGGYFRGNKFPIPELRDGGELDVLFGINLARPLDLRFWMVEMKGEIPAEAIIVGGDPGGNFIVLEDGRVWYYDHQYRFPQSSDNQNSYFVADTFGEFLNLLGSRRGSTELEGPLGPKLAENVWHYAPQSRSLQEVPRDIHARFMHRGHMVLTR
jgi:hypothetical protein